MSMDSHKDFTRQPTSAPIRPDTMRMGGLCSTRGARAWCESCHHHTI